MTWVLSSLVILAAAAGLSLVLAGAPRLALGTALLGMLTASVLLLVAAASVLLVPFAPTPQVIAWSLPLGDAVLALDGLSAWFLMTMGFVGAAVAVYTLPYMSDSSEHRGTAAFGALLCVLLAAMILVITAADAVLFLVGWEAVMLTAFFLIATNHHRAEVYRGAWMYMIANHLGTACCVLPLFAVLAGMSGSTAFAAFSLAASQAQPGVATLLFLLGVVGFGTKAGFMPMHVWLPAAHPVAPTPVSALLSGVVVKMGIYGLLRLLTWLPPLPVACGYLLLAVAIVSGVMGVLYALAQHDLKRLLAYHTVENLGIIALGIGIGILATTTGHPTIAALAYGGALLHVTNHALFKGLLFLSAGAVLHGTGTTDIERLGGLAKRTPVNAILFLVGAIAICGLPPLNGFVSEWLLYGSLFGGTIHRAGGSGAATALSLVALALMGGLALACFAKVFGVVFLGELRDASLRPRPTPMLMKAAMAGLALLCLVIGIGPGLWIPALQRATAVLMRLSPNAELEPALQTVLSPAATLSLLAGVFLVIALGLVTLRRWVLARAAARDRGRAGSTATWGCGFSQPTARVQYTASSFAGSLIGCFRSLLWPERALDSSAGPFPTGGRLQTHVPDIAEQDLFAPMFRAVAFLFAMVRTVSWSGAAGRPKDIITAASTRRGPVRTMAAAIVGLRHGSTQVHLAFIVLTLVAVFLVESLSSPTVPNGVPVHESAASVSARVEP